MHHRSRVGTRSAHRLSRPGFGPRSWLAAARVVACGLAACSVAALVATGVLATRVLADGGSASVTRADGDLGATRAVLVEANPAPGLSVELAGVYPHATDDDLYWLLANKITAYMADQTPYLPTKYRGRLLLVERHSGEVVKTYPLNLGHYGGLASDGRWLFVSSLHPPEILKVDPETGAIVQRAPVSGQVGGLEYDREQSVLLAQLYLQYPHLAEIDPETGKLLRVLWSEESTMGIAMVRGDLISTWSGRGHFAAGSELHFHDRNTGRILHRAPIAGVHGAMAPLDEKVAGYAGFLSVAVRDVDHAGHTEIRRYRYVTAQEFAALEREADSEGGR
ncbi:MAG: PQQ-binding-like beta-propeller repeat protein [Acidobacteriota bacterium]